MRTQSLVAALLLGALGTAAFAQTDSKGVTESTDPAKAAAVERHAQELRVQQANATMMHEPTGAGATQKHRHHRHQRHHKASKAAAETTKP